MKVELTETEKAHIRKALECVLNSGDAKFDRQTKRLIKIMEG